MHVAGRRGGGIDGIERHHDLVTNFLHDGAAMPFGDRREGLEDLGNDLMRFAVTQCLVQRGTVADIGEQDGDLVCTGRHRSPRDGDGAWARTLVAFIRVFAGRADTTGRNIGGRGCRLRDERTCLAIAGPAAARTG